MIWLGLRSYELNSETQDHHKCSSALIKRPQGDTLPHSFTPGRGMRHHLDPGSRPSLTTKLSSVLSVQPYSL